jgi:hypothetical protein
LTQWIASHQGDWLNIYALNAVQMPNYTVKDGADGRTWSYTSEDGYAYFSKVETRPRRAQA